MQGEVLSISSFVSGVAALVRYFSGLVVEIHGIADWFRGIVVVFNGVASVVSGLVVNFNGLVSGVGCVIFLWLSRLVREVGCAGCDGLFRGLGLSAGLVWPLMGEVVGGGSGGLVWSSLGFYGFWYYVWEVCGVV